MKKNIALTSAFVALFAAIVCVGCFMKIPAGGIWIVLQNVLCILTAVLLGGAYGGLPTAVFLLAGLIGLPVYSGGTSGFGVWLGPSGGFLPGYLLGAIAAGFIAGKPSVQQKKPDVVTIVRVVLALLAGMIILYVPGIIWARHWVIGNNKVPADKTAMAVVMSGWVLSYLPFDALKIVVSVPVALVVRPIVAQYLFPDFASKKQQTNEAE